MLLRRIAPFRRTVQFLLLAAILLMPFISINGNPALRMDIGRRTLFMVGTAIRIDQFYLVLLAALVMVAGFLLLTVVLGRVWCGWLCPQTVLNDLADQSHELLQPFLSERGSRIAAHLFVLLLSMIVSINLLCWFMPPAEVIRTLALFHIHPVVMVCFSSASVLFYLDLILVKRSFCRCYCPYGRFQAALLDQGTLNLAFIEESRGRCLRCNSCIKSCPMAIDIRQGFQIECINCGRCIDACRDVMELQNGGAGLIAYRFGESAGIRPLTGAKTVMLTLLLCVLSAVLAWGIHDRSDTAFSVQRIATAETRTLADGSIVQAWRAIIGNRGEASASFALVLSRQTGMDAELLGPVSEIRIDPNENRQVSFFIRFSAATPVHQPFELRLLKSGVPVSTIKVSP